MTNETKQAMQTPQAYRWPVRVFVIGMSLALVLSVTGAVSLGQDYAQEELNAASDDSMSGLTDLLVWGPVVGAFALLVSLVWCLCEFLSRHTRWHEPWGQPTSATHAQDAESTRA